MENEKRLIDANAFIEEYCKHCGGGCDLDDECCSTVDDLMKANIVDAVEVTHGRWIMTLYTTTSKRCRVIANKKFACSVCGYCNGRKQSNYCPQCGADMRERKDNGSTQV